MVLTKQNFAFSFYFLFSTFYILHSTFYFLISNFYIKECLPQ